MQLDVAELHVAVGILQAADGAVLITQRPPHKTMPGAWEFPGGKIATGETPLAGLARELREELGIEIQLARHFARYQHTYPDYQVHLYVWKVLAWKGAPEGLEGQPLQWLAADQLLQAGLLPADEPLARLLERPVAVNGFGWEAALGAESRRF